jgi:hypothetical protein
MSDESFDSGSEKPDRFDERIKQLLRAEPFHPFTIVLTSGDRIPITSGFSLVIGDRTLWTAELIKTGTFWIRKSQIVGIEIPEPIA